jgi:tRNA1(Val) A37 N6-methylase TrmN6
MSDTPTLSPRLTDDAFLGGALSILQPASGYRAGLDAVLLAAAARAAIEGRARVLDAGSGVGVVGLAIAARVADANVTLVELDPVLADLARRNAERNGLDGRVRVIIADVTEGGRVLHEAETASGLAPASFEHVVTNPPFYEAGSGTPPRLKTKAAAHQMREGALDRWMAFLATAAASDGKLTLIHRADALAAVLSALDGRFGCIRVLPVHPRAGASANRILVTAIKGSRAALRAGLVLQDAEGRYLPAVEAVLRHGEPLVV